MTEDSINTVELATELTIAWLSNPNTRAAQEDVPAFLKSMHQAVTGLADDADAAPAEAPARQYTGAVTARKSLASRDVILSMIDGKPYKTLTRHLTTNGLTASEYRTRYGLKPDYPVTAPAYSETRRAMAKKIGLGRKPGQKMNPKAAPTATVKTGKPKTGKPATAKPTAAKKIESAQPGNGHG